MRDWQAFVRERLRLPGLTPEREARIVRELAAQLEDFYRDALARGATDDARPTPTRAAQIQRLGRMAQDVWRADRRARPARASIGSPTLDHLTSAQPQRPLTSEED